MELERCFLLEEGAASWRFLSCLLDFLDLLLVGSSSRAPRSVPSNKPNAVRLGKLAKEETDPGPEAEDALLLLLLPGMRRLTILLPRLGEATGEEEKLLADWDRLDGELALSFPGEPALVLVFAVAAEDTMW